MRWFGEAGEPKPISLNFRHDLEMLKEVDADDVELLFIPREPVTEPAHVPQRE